MRRTTTNTGRDFAGRPRLVLEVGGMAAAGSAAATGVQREFALLPERTVIGSGPGADLRLAGLSDREAEVRRDEGGEYVFVHLGRVGEGRVNGQPVSEAVLHTGDRIQLGGWVLSYARDEHADRSSSGGDRQGGEGR